MTYPFATTTLRTHRAANTASGRGTLNDPAWTVVGVLVAVVLVIYLLKAF